LASVTAALGKVAAGPPLEAVENIEGAISIPEEWAKGSGLFIVRVDREGMSMSPTFSPRTYLLVKQGAFADEGTIVLAMVDGEVTVKRLFQEEGFKREMIVTSLPSSKAFIREISFPVPKFTGSG
jgi:SOS-response transcriptional repressor LexA